ncbi:hypothetical protein J6590_098227 [Homalodisca vitripennis]|nr:hypothetical protein J6590_098227 [Homalodisca vitripennis]
MWRSTKRSHGLADVRKDFLHRKYTGLPSNLQDVHLEKGGNRAHWSGEKPYIPQWVGLTTIKPLNFLSVKNVLVAEIFLQFSIEPIVLATLEDITFLTPQSHTSTSMSVFALGGTCFPVWKNGSYDYIKQNRNLGHAFSSGLSTPFLPSSITATNVTGSISLRSISHSEGPAPVDVPDLH